MSSHPFHVPLSPSTPRLAQLLHKDQLPWKPEKPTIPLSGCSVFLGASWGSRNTLNNGSNFVLRESLVHFQAVFLLQTPQAACISNFLSLPCFSLQIIMY